MPIVVNTVVFLWISAESATPQARAASGQPSREALSTLIDFGRARGLTFAPLAAQPLDRPLGSPADDPALVDAVEAELEQARTALSALEEAAASARLTRVERRLLAHPHLPQAAFLMGECLALQAQAAREHSPALALALEARRTALEGTRAPAFGAPLSRVPTPEPASVTLVGLGAEDELELDAAPLGAVRQVSLVPGLHHARVWRRGRLVFAAFLELAPQQTSLELSAPRLVACSSEDLADAAGDAPLGHVACERWARVRAEQPGIGVALCEHQHCRPFVHWQLSAASPFAPIPIDRAPALPAWATLTIAGAAALVTTGLVLWQAGAFEQGRPSAAHWEYDGLNPQALKF
jgi:hypothetical protein